MCNRWAAKNIHILTAAASHLGRQPGGVLDAARDYAHQCLWRQPRQALLGQPVRGGQRSVPCQLAAGALPPQVAGPLAVAGGPAAAGGAAAVPPPAAVDRTAAGGRVAAVRMPAATPPRDVRGAPVGTHTVVLQV